MEKMDGDLIALACAGTFDVMIHGCNCFHTMGAGIAKAVVQEFPEAMVADKTTKKGDRAKLGTISVATVWRAGHELHVVNAYTQFDFRGRGRKVDYEALSRCFVEVARRFAGARIGYPMIGAGLAGGDWDEISGRIDAALEGQNHMLVVLPA